MMTSNLVSRLLPSTAGAKSIYETIREHDQAPGGETQDAENEDNTIDERNLQEPFHDHDIENLLVEAAESTIATESTAFLNDTPQQRPPSRSADPRQTPRWMGKLRAGALHFDEEDDVPESLLLEDHEATPEIGERAEDQAAGDPQRLPSPVPGPSTKRSRVQWDTARARQALHGQPKRKAPVPPKTTGRMLVSAEPAEKARWRWANVENLDNFLKEVYAYYLDKGIWSILLNRFFSLLTGAFVVGLVTFLASCIDYANIPGSNKLSQVIIPKCTQNMSAGANFLLWVFSFLWVIKLFEYITDVRRLWHLHDFYHYLLAVTDQELQTISWQDVVSRLMDLRDSNPRTALNLNPRATKYIGDQAKQRMDAHDIANRLMRRENYLIALFNKDILDLTLPLPFLGNRQLFSKTLEWSINNAVMDYVFNEQGQVQQLFLKDTHRRYLIEALKRRFVFLGFMNVICAPFIIAYLLFFYFLRYFTEFRTNPGQLGSRAYTPLAEWKFREFNELYHLFERRTDMSYPFASRYIDQFPKHKTTQAAKFVAFIAGALAAVLAVASLVDPDLFFGFEVTPDRTVLFYLGILGTIWAIARGMVPEENMVFDPEFAIQNVVDYTHYCPAHWKGRLHSDDVRKDFSALYQMKIVIFLQEILSIIFTPFVLWFSLPNCSERLVDFFREFTIHVDGLGYVCSFALFDFKKGYTSSRQTPGKGHETAGKQDPSGLREDYYSTKDGKMLASYYSFIDSYANNPRRAAGHNQRRRHFNPPPTFPGLASPGSMPQNQPTTLSRMASDVRGVTPSPSMLLDPHHQPSSASILRGRGPNARQQLQRQITQPEFTDEQENEDQTATSQPRGVTSSTIIEQDSNLGDSWKTTLGAAAEDNPQDHKRTSSADDQDATTPGVLGLLYQFQKAQTEGRGKSAGLGL